MSQQQRPVKWGENHVKAMKVHGLVELRNAFQFDQSNITEDVRWSMPRENQQSQGHGQQQVQQQELQQEHRLER